MTSTKIVVADLLFFSFSYREIDDLHIQLDAVKSLCRDQEEMLAMLRVCIHLWTLH